MIFVPGLAFAAVQEALFFYAFSKPSIQVFRIYSRFYPAFRVYVVTFAIAAIVHFGLAHQKSQDEESRSQIKWIFFGLIVGLAPFLFLYETPLLLGLKPLLSEEVSSLFFVVLPTAVAIAVVKYRLMDIVLVINRSLVYSLLTVFIVAVYLLVVEVIQALMIRIIPVRRGFFAVVGVFAAAAVFRPAQKRIQDFVDRAFFRQRYDYRQTIFEFNERAVNLIGRDALLRYFLQIVQGTIPVEALSLAIDFRKPAGAGQDIAIRLGDSFGLDPSLAPGEAAAAEIWARRFAVEAADLVDFSRDVILEQNGIELALSLPLSRNIGRGVLVLGKKKSSSRYSREDIELLRTLVGELSVSLERIFLQEEVIYERASKEKLDELNRLKTEFVSAVSHELRTPMSSIQGLAEVLQAGKFKSKEERERYINLMVAESGRLSRFLHNVLDFGRIERKVKTYHFQPADLRMIVEEAVDLFRMNLDQQGFTFSLRLPVHPVELRVDADAIKQALINLIDNAIKYSAQKKFLGIEVREGEKVEISVEDRGIGVSSEDAARIFDHFFRGEAACGLCPQGAGLGLKIVKHIMEGHGGEVRVESETGRGSVFRLIFGKS
jgi:signal transduction histidine kinase